METLKSIVGFFAEHPRIFAVLLGLGIAWASTFALEQRFFPDEWSQRKCEFWATAISMLVGFIYSYGFWRVLVPADGREYIFLVASGAALAQPFLYWGLSKLVGWKWPGLDLTFGPKQRP